jgi:hypothetical protein
MRRHLEPLLRRTAAGQPAIFGFLDDDQLPDEFSWRDFAIFLLHIAAEIEHSLMVQYLYAAYSLGGAGLPDTAREQARVWREIVLGIAKEEMAHLITVQNILRCIGGPLHLEREDYPYRSEFYPFHFRLEPLSKGSLAKYIYAEAPADWEGTQADEVRELAEQSEAGDLNRVGALYDGLVRLFNDPARIPDDQFLATTFDYQASGDEWSRGYSTGERGNQSGQNVRGTPHLIIERVRTRQEVVDALNAISKQGESPTDTESEQSHFRRFLRIYEELGNAAPPVKPVPSNPSTSDLDAEGKTVIKNLAAVRWCHLFDLRYRMLLYRLKHAFFVRAGESVTTPTARGNLIAWVFAEMYNLRVMAGIVMDLPLDAATDAARAAPPFDMPYTLSLPDWDSDKWRMHRDLITASKALSAKIRTAGGDGQSDFLQALDDNDDLADRIVQELLRRAVEKERQARP